MKSEKNTAFWPSYTDLMTSLFFVMLVLFVLVYAKQQKQIKDLNRTLAIVNAVDQNIKPLKNDTAFFEYEEKYKRFKLRFDVQFKKGKSNILQNELDNYDNTIPLIDAAGDKLKRIIDNLYYAKLTDSSLKDISYMLVIAGSASAKTGSETENYVISYHRALALRDYWKSKQIDFESGSLKDFIDLQISGNGIGGIGRLESDEANQRFLIQVIPKIGDIKK